MEGGKKTLPALFFTTVEKAGARPFTRWFRDHPDVPATKWETLSWVRCGNGFHSPQRNAAVSKVMGLQVKPCSCRVAFQRPCYRDCTAVSNVLFKPLLEMK